MADNKKPTDDLLKAMEKFITTKSVVGEPVVVGDTIILPMADVSFGMGMLIVRFLPWWGFIAAAMLVAVGAILILRKC